MANQTTPENKGASPAGYIRLRGVSTHNLNNIDVDIPRNQLVVLTGPSGSGKSSLAFDTLYAEGQRRYVESLSAYARQFLSVMAKPPVDSISGLSPAIAIEQKASSHNPRSTVGTTTEIYDYLRLLYARVGQPLCPTHKQSLRAQSISQMVDSIMARQEGSRIMLLAPMVRGRKGEHHTQIARWQQKGFLRLRVNGEVVDIDAVPPLAPKSKHTIDVVVDRLKIKPGIEQRLAESLELITSMAEGLALVTDIDEGESSDQLFSSKHACPHCGYSVPTLEPRLFSFNNPHGACEACDGLGVFQTIDPEKVVTPSLSIADGAIRGWDQRHLYYYQLMQALSEHYGIDLQKPFEKIAKSKQDLILYGSGDEPITFHYLSPRGGSVKRTHPFEGVIPNMRRRYLATDKEAVRNDLARYLSEIACEACHGTRLNSMARHVEVEGKAIYALCDIPISEAWEWVKQLHLHGRWQAIANKIVRELQNRLGFLAEVGLGYLTLGRASGSLSGGESQRIRLASQIGSGLTGVMYILDEPSIGLHQRDNARLLNTLRHLRDLGNSVIVVEHDEDTMQAADYLLDIGPGAGVHGGTVVAEGTVAQIKANPHSITGAYLSGKKCIPVPSTRHPRDATRLLTLQGATANNLQNVEVSIPVGLMTCVTGVSGSGKSSLINATLYPRAAMALNKARFLHVGPCDALLGLGHFDKVIAIDQSPIGRTPRSNPATYTGLFTPIRELFAATEEARARGYAPGRFSFNVRGGRCDSCEGDGLIRVEMHFLADVYVTCDLCQGKRYNRETLEVLYKGKNIHQILAMSVEDAFAFFHKVPALKRRLQTLMDVGLGYITLGQSATTLSGGEAQRIKLARELAKRDTGNTLYLLDEPTTGLHFEDVQQLLHVLQRLRDHGNTIVVIEHHLDVIKTADWIIDMGPDGGRDGGHVVACGTPEDVAQVKGSYTGRFLKPLLKRARQP